MKRLNKYRGKGTQGVWSPVKCKACTDAIATEEVQVTERRTNATNRTLSYTYTSFLCDKCQTELSTALAITQIRELSAQAQAHFSGINETSHTNSGELR